MHEYSSSENAQSNGKKTIVPQDVINALKDAEFESFLPRVEAELKSMWRNAKAYHPLPDSTRV